MQTTHTRWEPRDKNEARKAVERKLLRNSRAPFPRPQKQPTEEHVHYRNHTHTHARTRARAHARTHARTHTHTHTHTHTRRHTHTHTHKHEGKEKAAALSVRGDFRVHKAGRIWTPRWIAVIRSVSGHGCARHAPGAAAPPPRYKTNAPTNPHPFSAAAASGSAKKQWAIRFHPVAQGHLPCPGVPGQCAIRDDTWYPLRASSSARR